MCCCEKGWIAKDEKGRGGRHDDDALSEEGGGEALDSMQNASTTPLIHGFSLLHTPLTGPVRQLARSQQPRHNAKAKKTLTK